MNPLQMACVWRPACFAKPRAKLSTGTAPIRCSARGPFVRWLLPPHNSRNTEVTSRHSDGRISKCRPDETVRNPGRSVPRMTRIPPRCIDLGFDADKAIFLDTSLVRYPAYTAPSRDRVA